MNTIDQASGALLGHDRDGSPVSIHADESYRYSRVSHLLVSGTAAKRARVFAHLARQFPAAGSHPVLIRSASVVPTAPDLRTLRLSADTLAQYVGAVDVLRQPYSELWRTRRGTWMLSALVCLDLLRGEHDERTQVQVGHLLEKAVESGVSTSAEALPFLREEWVVDHSAEQRSRLERLLEVDFVTDPIWQVLVGTADPCSVSLIDQVLTENIEVIELGADLPMPPYWVTPQMWSKAQRRTVVLLSALLGSISVPLLEQDLAVLVEDMDAALAGTSFMKHLVNETSRTAKSDHIWVTGTASQSTYSLTGNPYAIPRVLDLGEAGDALARTNNAEFDDEILERRLLLRLPSE